MKKVTVILTMVLVLALSSVTVFAKGPGCGQGKNYTDANGDGICDNRGTGQCQAGNGCGYGNGCGNRNGNGCGSGYVDADGDGVCDNASYSIKYKLNGGKNNKNNPSSYNTAKSVKLKNPTRKNYTFMGWYTDKNFKNKVTSIKKGSVGKKTLYAKWEKK